YSADQNSPCRPRIQGKGAGAAAGAARAAAGGGGGDSGRPFARWIRAQGSTRSTAQSIAAKSRTFTSATPAKPSHPQTAGLSAAMQAGTIATSGEGVQRQAEPPPNRGPGRMAAKPARTTT